MGEDMNTACGDINGETFVKQVYELAFSKSNDMLRLLFPDKGAEDFFKDLDLRMVSEIKRNDKGGVEVKMQNQIELLRLLAQYIIEEKAAPLESSEAQSFFTALDKAAAKLEDEEK